MKLMSKTLVATGLAMGALVATSFSASASIVCSENVCWHVQEVYQYPPEAHVIVHPDSWHWDSKVIIREHTGRGYWRGDQWVVIQ